MKEPIKAGDLCKVISGMLGTKSPNIGLIVTVATRVYECPQLGVIWRCTAEYAIQHDTTRARPPGQMDFAQSWLRKIEPPTMADQIREEHAAGLDG